MTFTDFLNSPKSAHPHYLLIGNPVSHSISPLMHDAALSRHGIDAEYIATSVSLGEINSLIAHFNKDVFLGANITIPYKQNLLEAMDLLSPEAKAIEAINTIAKEGSKLTGHNTDAYGFSVPLKEYEKELLTERAIIFGTGGASKAIIFALNDLGFEEVVMVSRNPGNFVDVQNNIRLTDYSNWQEFTDDASLIINATPLGMKPNVDISPVRDQDIGFLAGKICYDIVYNPRETKFLNQSKKAGGIPIGGLDMLIHQGAESFKIWTGKEFPIALIKMKLDEIFPY